MEHIESMGKRIKLLREKNGFTQSQMAHKLNINPASFSSYERDNSIPPSDKLAQIADLLFTTMDFLAGRIEDPAPYDLLRSQLEHPINISESGLYKIPLVGQICAGNGLIAESNIEDYVVYPVLGKRQPDFALKVKGDSMIGAGIEDGDIVFIRKANWAEFNGQIVAAVINGEEGMLKRMKWDAGSPSIKLVPENDQFSVKEAMPYEVIVCGVYEGHFKQREVQE